MMYDCACTRINQSLYYRWVTSSSTGVLELAWSKISWISCPTSGEVLFFNLPGQSQSPVQAIWHLLFDKEEVLLNPLLDFCIKRQKRCMCFFFESMHSKLINLTELEESTKPEQEWDWSTHFKNRDRDPSYIIWRLRFATNHAIARA